MVQTDYKQELIEKVKENYLSVALGILVFLVAVTLIFRSGKDEQPPVVEEAMEAPSQKTYVVQRGDSVSSIALSQLGSMDHTQAIIEANQLDNANQIEVGQELIIPDVAGEVMTPSEDAMAATPTATMNRQDAMMKSEPTKAPQTVTITGDTYTVKKGDHLWDIAERAYGDGNQYTLIIEANKLRNPDRLEEGTVLKLPRNTK